MEYIGRTEIFRIGRRVFKARDNEIMHFWKRVDKNGDIQWDIYIEQFNAGVSTMIPFEELKGGENIWINFEKAAWEKRRVSSIPEDLPDV